MFGRSWNTLFYTCARCEQIQTGESWRLFLIPGDYRICNLDGSVRRWSPAESEPRAGVCVHLHHGTFTVHMTFCPVCTFLRIINVDGQRAETIQNGRENMSGRRLPDAPFKCPIRSSHCSFTLSLTAHMAAAYFADIS